MGKQKSFELGNAAYSCCCQLDANQTDITCELVEVTNMRWKKCGSLKGAGFHAWYNIKTIRKYSAMEHAGKCVVPWKLLEVVLTAAPVEQERTTETALATTTTRTATAQEDA